MFKFELCRNKKNFRRMHNEDPVVFDNLTEGNCHLNYYKIK